VGIKVLSCKIKLLVAVLFAAVLFAVVMVFPHGRKAILIGFTVGGFISIVGYVSLRKKLRVIQIKERLRNDLETAKWYRTNTEQQEAEIAQRHADEMRKLQDEE